MNKPKTKPKYYAYKIISTNKTSIVENWKDCEKEVKGKNANYKDFTTKQEAQQWLKKGAKYEKNKKKSNKSSKTQENNMKNKTAN